MKTLCGWVGGKCYLSSKILPFPSHHYYIEPFVGGGGMFFNKPPSKIEIINDVNHRLINLYRQIQENTEKVAIECFRQGSISSRQIGDECKSESSDPTTDAFRFLYLNRHSFSGRTNRFQSLPQHHRNFINKVKEFDQIRRRLQHVIIECQDFRHIFARFEKLDAFFYVDPPYFKGGQIYSEIVGGEEWTEKDFDDLVNLLRHLKSKFILSYDRIDWMTNEDRNRWTIQPIQREMNMNNYNRMRDGKGSPIWAMEYIIRNYKIQKLDTWG